jgi:alcohol dehydrogenase (cytochrome c)
MKNPRMPWTSKSRFFAALGMTSLRVSALILFIIGAGGASSMRAQVTVQRLLDSGKEPQNWLMYSGDYAGRRFSALEQINTGNAATLVPKWAYQTMAGGKFETTPLVVDGILYGTGQDNRAFALDARSGRPIWQYQRALPADIRPCCGRVNRGMAILGDKVFLGTLDAHVLALDAKTGNVVWDVTTVDYRGGYSITLAPLVIKNLVMIGVSGGEYGIRGFIDAYDTATGERKWRFYTVPGPGEPGHETWEGDSWKIGGAPAWITGTYDPATNTTFWTTGNPSPSNRGEGRAGDNLYSNSLLALEPETGKLKWYFQFSKHDEHDYDATQVPVMVDQGERHLILQANRNGFFFVVDRSNGKLVFAELPLRERTLRRHWKGIACARARPARRTGCRRRTIRKRSCSTLRQGNSATFSARQRRRTKRGTLTTAARISRMKMPSRSPARCGRSIRTREN